MAELSSAPPAPSAFFDYEFRKQAYEHLKARDINKLIIMGGDGSFRALNDFFNDFEVPFAGIPATIDNDIAGTDYCLGVDTAQNVILDCIDSVRDTARSHHRAFVIETMGRDCGYLAMTTALCSAADICIVPEIPYDLESIYKRLQPAINEEGSCIIAVVAEGTRVAQYLTRWLTERAGMNTRLTVLGHVQRGGSPSARDRLMAPALPRAPWKPCTRGTSTRSWCTTTDSTAMPPWMPWPASSIPSIRTSSTFAAN